MIRHFVISLAIAAALVTGGCKKEPSAEADAQKQLQEAQVRLEQAQQQAAEAQRRLDEAQREAEQARQQQQLEEARKKLDEAQRQAASARRQLEEARQKASQSQAVAGGAAAEQKQAPSGQPAGAASPATSAVAPAPPAPRPITVPAGTQIVIRTTTTLSTKDLKNGDHFSATLQEPLVIDGVTIAAKGAEVEGVVVDSDPGGRVKGVAQLGVALRSVQTAAGKVEIQTGAYVAEAKGSVKKDVTRGAIMTGVGAAIGAIAGGGKGAAVGAGVGAGAGTATAIATRGEAATIPAESVLTFQLKSPVTVTLK